MEANRNHLSTIRTWFVLMIGLVLLCSSISPVNAYQLRRDDTSGALGIAWLCSQMLHGISRNPSLVQSVLLPLYEQGLQEILNTKLSATLDEMSQAIGVIRGWHIRALSRNPSLSDAYTEQVERCFSDIEMLKKRKRGRH